MSYTHISLASTQFLTVLRSESDLSDDQRLGNNWSTPIFFLHFSFFHVLRTRIIMDGRWQLPIALVLTHCVHDARSKSDNNDKIVEEEIL